MKQPVQSLSVTSILAAFSTYLQSLSLSSISRKLYRSDLLHFLNYFTAKSQGDIKHITLDDLTNPSTYLSYLSKPEFINSSSLARRHLASLRQFGSFICQSYNLPNPTQNLTLGVQGKAEASLISLSKYIKTFTEYLKSDHLSLSTIKSYKSDMIHYLTWGHSNYPSTHIVELLTTKFIGKYMDSLVQSHSHGASTMLRKSKVIARFAAWIKQTLPQIQVSDNNNIGDFLRKDSVRTLNADHPHTPALSTPHISITANTLPDQRKHFVKRFNYRTALTTLILVIMSAALSIFGYRQFSSDVKLTAAFPNTPVTPNRQLSFQGRLENAAGTPITSATNFVFKLYDDPTTGTELYSSGTCSITPDTDGVFSTQIGSTCGAGITSSVFTENADVWMQVTVGAETLTPRQQIATVAYALNSETIQGFPISATVSAIRNTVVPMNQWGEIIVGEQSPRLTGVAGTFAISAPSLSLTTTAGTNGNITLAPDGTGQVNVNGNTTTTSFFNINNAQLTTGSLITGTAANNNTGFKLLDLLSGSSPTSKFSVSDAGNVSLAGDLTISGDDLFMNTNTAGMLLIADGTNFNPTAVSGDITINGSGTTTIGSDKITEGMLKSVNAPTDELCLSYESTVGDFEWQTCGSGGGGSNWRINNGAISPNNDTLDLLVGNTATASAKAGFINISSGTPTATVSAGAAGGAFLTADGYLSTTARQSLTLGNSTTYNTSGDILLHPNGGANLLFGDTSNVNSSQGLTLNQAAFDNELLTLKSSDIAHGITGSSETDSYGVFTKADAASGGLTIRGIKDADGNPSRALNFEAYMAEDVTDSKGSSNQGLINFDTGVKPGGTFQSVAADGNLFSISNNSSTKLIIDAESTLHHIPGSDTNVDIATVQVTGTPTLAWNEASDIFTFNKGVGFGGTTHYINASGNSNLNSLTLPSATSLTFGTTSLGETTAANDSGAYVVGTFDEFDNSNSANVQDVLDDLDAVLTTALSGGGAWTDAGTYLHPTSGEVLGNATLGGTNKLAGIYLADSAPLMFGTDNDFSFAFNNSTSTLGSTLTSGTRFGINTTSALATFDVRSSLGTIPVASISGNTSMAALVVDQSGSGDIFTASSSGQTRFVVKSNGNVGIDVSDPTNKLEIGGSTSTISNDAGDITFDSASNNLSFAGDSLINILNTYVSGELGVGVADAIGRFHVHGATTGKALALFNELGDQDILVASSSGSTRARITNSGSLILDGDYLNFGLTDSSSGYGFRDNGGTLQFKHNSGSWADVGSGISVWTETAGVLSPTTLGNVVAATTSATTALTITQTGAFKALLVEDEASDATPFVINDSGNVGIGVASPTQKLEVNGYVVGQRFEDSSSSTYYVDPAAAGTSISIDGDIVSNGTFTMSSNGNNNITIDAGSGTVLIGAAGGGKLDAGTIDPPYTINGEKFATYVAGMTGVKEETTGVVQAQEYIPGIGYRATLDFANSLTGSDLWLFSKASSLKNQLDKLVVLTTASGNTRTWYQLDAQSGLLHLYAQAPTTISYRLTAPRYDATNWLNTRTADSASIGHIIDDPDSWSVSNAISSLFQPPTITPLISPLASGSAIIIAEDQTNIQALPPSAVDPILIVDGELAAATISARVAKLTDLQAQNITAQNITADTITANTIIGLDAKIASLSGLTDQEFNTITDRIKDRLSDLINPVTAEDIPDPSNASESGELDVSEWYSNTASDSATLSSADIDFVTINNYLAVIGQATITSLDVTNSLYTNVINTKTGHLALGDNILLVDNTGHVTINADLTVSGKILAESASVNQLEIGSPKEASSSALGNLLAIYNEAGDTVATIDASGSANLASLTTNMITIASSGTATDSSALSSLIGSASSNATAGIATLSAPNTELIIDSPYVTPNSLIYLTPTTNTDNKVLFVKSKGEKSFTVAIDAPASTDISFNWWIIELSPSTTNSQLDQQL